MSDKKTTWTFKEIPTSKKRKESAEKARLAWWISKEITSREYSQKEINSLIYLLKNDKKEEAWKTLLKGHKCPNACYCQKETKTWQEKMNKAQLLLQLSEREFNKAEQLRIKETTHLLTQQFRQQHE